MRAATRIRRLVCFRSDERGQMTVEAAVMIPVLIVGAFTIANLMSFVEACSAFDRIAADAVVSQGVSPTGIQTESAACEQVQACIEDALGREGTCSVEVEASDVAHGWSQGASFSLFPELTRYTCTLSYRPWPGRFTIAGVTYAPPPVLTHTQTLVVDRYRAGVVV
jgi:hypothetical protein